MSYGAFYRVGDTFACPECETSWRKVQTGRFERQTDQRRFVRQQRDAEGDVFPYLTPEEGRGPLVERCCAQLLLRYGGQTRLAELYCPICRTRWRRSDVERRGLRIPVFHREGLAEPVALQAGTHRTFLVPLSNFSPPLE